MRIALSLLAILSVACLGEQERDGAPADGGATLKVYTVNYPLQYFAERIGSDFVDVSFPAPAEGDPAFWKPGADVIAAYQKADLILLNGASYAKWVERVSLPTSKLVDTSTSFRDRTIVIENAVVHTHGPEGAHSHAGTAFTTWIDPTLAVEQARAIRDALTAARPEHEASFQ